MAMQFGSRRVFIRGFEYFEWVEGEADVENYALLLPAFTMPEVELSLSSALHVVRSGCREICCVGQFSGALVDALDVALELEDRLK
jgi:hypothetical protein